MNIDKDIEKVEQFIEETQEEYSETLVDGKVYRIENIPLEFKPTKELANSISNVLADRETWKKIAEKLALRYADYLMDYEGRTGEKNHLIPTTAEKLLDWARNEVEKDD